MKKSINVKEPTELELQFSDGKSLSLLFDVEALTNFNNLPNGLTGYVKEKSLSERTAMIVYAGHLYCDNEFTIEDARKIVSSMDPATVTAINIEFTSSLGTNDNQIMQDFVKKNLTEIMKIVK